MVVDHIRGSCGRCAGWFLFEQIDDAPLRRQREGAGTRGQSPGAPSLSEIQASQQLAQNYGDLIKTRPTLTKVIQELSLSYGPNTLSKKITVGSPRSLIEIMVSDPDPQLAAQIANTVAGTFIDDFRTREFNQIAQFQASLSQQGIGQDPGVIAAQAATISRLSIVEGAIPPSSPSSPRTQRNVLIAAMLGLLTAGLIVFLLEHLDDRVKSPEELKTVTGISVVGSVLRNSMGDGLAPLIHSGDIRNSPIVESYRFLRTSLEFATAGTSDLRTLLVTTSSPAEGKTTIGANLAISLAQEGKSIILVDADLRKPNLHRVFALTEQKGLTHLLAGLSTIEETLAPTEVEGLRVVTSGPLPPDPTFALRSPRMRQVVEQLENSADLVIFDTSPLLSVTDPMLMAPLVDGVLFVVGQKTPRDTIKRGAEMLRQVDVSFVGSVLNNVTPDQSGYYYEYYYEGATERSPNWMPKLLSNLIRTVKREQNSGLG